ncbi:MAG: hypothetical protein ABI647_08935 [Gemmatimonadota bacterium]
MITIALTPNRLAALRSGSVIVPDQPAVFEIAGPGALTCMQGLLTNDLAASGDRSVVYGALLTPKGMIIVDAWVLRLGDRFVMIADRAGRAATSELFKRSLPPRLALVTDRTEAWEVLWLIGPKTEAVAKAAGVLGHLAPGAVTEDEVLVARPKQALAPFQLLVLAEPGGLAPIAERLVKAGGTIGTRDDLYASRVLVGWPSLGREIDERTLPQEARFEEIEGVSYTKGCYTGQETVARVHFRGHPNRLLRGLTILGAGPQPDGPIQAGGRDVGFIRSAISLPDRVLALSAIRREVAPGDQVMVGDRSATVVALPFDGAA